MGALLPTASRNTKENGWKEKSSEREQQQKLQEKHKTDRKTNREDNSIVALHEERHTTCTQPIESIEFDELEVFVFGKLRKDKIFWKWF